MSSHTLEDDRDLARNSNEKRSDVSAANGTIVRRNTEETPLLEDDQKEWDEDDDEKGTGYAKHKALGIVRKWRHWMIGVISFSSFCAVILSYYVLLEYTKNRLLDIEFENANLTRGNETVITCNTNTTGAVYETESRANEKSSLWITYYSLTGLPSILTLLILGSYTDVLGRKFFLTIGIMGTFICATITALVIHFEADLKYMLIGKLVEGICGQHGTLLQVSLAYTSDITKPGKSRIYGMIAIEITIGIALSTASFVSGFIIEAFGYTVAVLTSAGLSFLNIILTWTLLPETLTKKYRHKGKSCWTIVKTCWNFVVENDSENRRWKYQLVFTILTICNLSYLGRIPIEILYELASPFCWSQTRVGVYAAIRTLVMMFLGLTSVKILQRWLDEVSLCMLGTISYAASFYWTAVVDDTLSFYLKICMTLSCQIMNLYSQVFSVEPLPLGFLIYLIAVGCYGPVSTTMHRCILSHLTPPESQGALFTVVGVVEVTTLVIANTMNPAIYSQTVSYMRGLVFLLLGSFATVCVILLVILKVGMRMERKRRGERPYRTTEIIVDNNAN